MQVSGTTPLWIAARVLLCGKVDDFFRLKGKVLQTFDPEDIHDLRVASRRLREGLALFAPCYPPANIDRLTRQMKKVTRHLGAMRNADEALLFFSELAGELDACCRDDLLRLTRSFEQGRAEGLRKFRAGLERLAPPSLHRTCQRTINFPRLFAPPTRGVDPFVPLSNFADVAIAARLADVTTLVPEARQEGRAEAQHLLRIAVKHFRYRLEILSFLVGARFPEVHAALKGYQDLLGKMHDLDVFAGIVTEAGFSPSSEQISLAAIAAKRERLFADFTGMLTATSFEELGSRVRTAP